MKKLYDQNLFDETFVQSLPYLKTLIKKRLASGQTRGLFASPSYGWGEDFSYYVPYTPGDEMRYIDWNIVARTEEFFVKRSQQNKNMIIKILLDTSSSMSSGIPQKIKYVKKIAAAIIYVSLHSGSSVQLFILQNNHVYGSEIYKNPKYFLNALSFLSSFEAQGSMDMVKVLRQISFLIKKNEWIILLSDLFHAKHTHAILKKIAVANYLQLVHTTAKEDIVPPPLGEFVLQDMETNQEIMIKITREVQQQYEKRIKKFLDDWRQFSLRHNISYCYSNSQTPLLPTIIQVLQSNHF